MGGILSGNLPVFVVENATDGNRAYTTMHEGEGKVLRFGVYDESVGEHLKWMRDVLGVALSRALKLLPGGGLAVNPILAQAVAMGDEFHVRNTAASSLMYREIGPKLDAGRAAAEGSRVGLGLPGGEHQLLPHARDGQREGDAGRCGDDPRGQRRHVPDPERTRVRHPRQRDWATGGSPGPEDKLDTLFFPGFTEEDACPDCGDSAILEAYGLGGPMAVAAPSVQQMVGTGEGGFEDALATSEEQAEIMVAEQPEHADPELELQRRARRDRHPQGRGDGNRPPDHHGRHAQEGRDRDGRRREGPRLDAVLHRGARGTLGNPGPRVARHTTAAGACLARTRRRGHSRRPATSAT